MNVAELENMYRHCEEIGDDFTEHSKFIKLLLSENTREMTDYHYELLRRRKVPILYHRIRAAFRKRKDAESYLIDKLPQEHDPTMQADILQILGGLRSSHAAPLAREFVKHNDERHREVGLFVLGWVGDKGDIDILRTHMLTETAPLLRITAASAHRQIASRHPELKCDILRSLKSGFEKETNDEVLSWIIVMIGTIAIKNLGLREDKEDPHILHGDVQKAKKKAAAFLSTLP